MKLAVTVLAICTLPLAGQELKHLSVPTVSSVRPIDAAAHEVIREAPYIHLKGSVEIKTPVCLEAGPDNAQHCSGYVVLRADEADLHEESGQIEARGHVIVTREK